MVNSGGLVLNHVHPVTAMERTINFFIPGFHPIATVSHAYVLREPSKYTLKSFTNSKLMVINPEQLQDFLQGPENAKMFQEHGVRTMIGKLK